MGYVGVLLIRLGDDRWVVKSRAGICRVDVPLIIQ